MTFAPGELYRERPHPSSRADDQHLLARPNLSHVAERLKGGEARRRNGGRLLEGEACRLRSERRFARTRVLGEGAAAGAKHLVAPLEPGHPGPDRRDRTRNVLSRRPVFRLAQPVSHEAYQVRPARHEVPDAGVEARRVHA